VRAWSRAHETWLSRLTLDRRADQIVVDDDWSVVRDGRDRVRRLEAALVACAAESPHAQVLAALQAIRGIGFLSAVTIVAEAGDLRRFPTARAFMAYVGLVPAEYSSGAARHRGRITKTGNRLIRHVLGQARLHARYRHLAGWIGVNKAVTAIARELAGFVWALGQLLARPVAA
jgi:transposase